jgi:hypothetical protein
MMKLFGKYYGLLFIALFLLYPFTVLSFADQNKLNYGTSDTSCFSKCTDSEKTARNHAICETEEDDLIDAGSSCPSYMNLFSSIYLYTPSVTCPGNKESRKKLPIIFTSIFVPPQ